MRGRCRRRQVNRTYFFSLPKKEEVEAVRVKRKDEKIGTSRGARLDVDVPVVVVVVRVFFFQSGVSWGRWLRAVLLEVVLVEDGVEALEVGLGLIDGPAVLVVLADDSFAGLLFGLGRLEVLLGKEVVLVAEPGEPLG